MASVASNPENGPISLVPADHAVATRQIRLSVLVMHAQQTGITGNPTSPARTDLRTPWTADDYHIQRAAARKGGTWKLADSGVAPLVAQARGYEIVTDKEGAKALASHMRATEGRLRVQRSITAMLHDGLDDVLVMPWYAIDEVAEDGLARSRDVQYRPSTPPADESGKIRKYLWLPGASMALDVHPATPNSWITETGAAGHGSVLLIEGLLKADSVLTALLTMVHGADALGLSGSVEEARERMRALMEAVPRSLRALVVASASVTTWDHPEQWRQIALKGRRTIVAFDGDLAVNPNVWRQTDKAMQFLSRRADRAASTIALWDASVAVAAIAAGFAPEQKIGMDEFLTRVGTLQDALDLMTTDLPPEPAAIRDASVGDWRVRPSCPAIVEELTQPILPDGTRGQARWEVRSHIGLEILEVRSTRLPIEEESRTGTILPDADVPSIEEIVAKFHVLAHDGDPEYDEVQSYEVRMPASALAATRAGDWASLIRTGALRLPAAVLTHPHYAQVDLGKWLAAAKASSSVDVTQGWARMGWVPTGTGGAFLTGSQVIAATVEEERQTVSGLTASVMPRAGAWGVEDHYRELTHLEWQKALVKDVREALSIWFGAFRDRQIASIALGMMLRPTMPVRGAGSVCLVTGRAGSGKSLVASYMLAGWGAYSGAWTHQSLPGTASDTIASTEIALSQAPLWVMDDLAPNTDAGRGASRASSVEDMIRGVFNGTPRRRMGDAPVPPAIAHLIVTAENAPTVESIRQRTWELDLAGGLLVEGGRERLDAAIRDGLYTRLTGYAIRGWVSGRNCYSELPWAQRMAVAGQAYDEAAATVERLAAQIMGDTPLSTVPRQLEKAAALYGPLYGLGSELTGAMLATGETLEGDATMALLDEGIPQALVDHALSAAAEHARNTPGRLALRAIATMLHSGQAHLTRAVSTHMAPAGTDAERAAAGWQVRGDGWVAQGPAIGAVGVTASGEKIVILDRLAAFTAAAKAYPQLIPSGSTARAAWASLAGETELLPGDAIDRVRVRDDATTTEATRLQGVVVRWEGLMALAD